MITFWLFPTTVSSAPGSSVQEFAIAFSRSDSLDKYTIFTLTILPVLYFLKWCVCVYLCMYGKKYFQFLNSLLPWAKAKFLQWMNSITFSLYITNCYSHPHCSWKSCLVQSSQGDMCKHFPHVIISWTIPNNNYFFALGFINLDTGATRWFSGLRCLMLRVMIWSWSLELTWYKNRLTSRALASKHFWWDMNTDTQT